jgi:hypothetical protein
MSAVPRSGNLEIDQDMDFVRRQWVVRRIALGLMVLLVLLGLLGLEGGSGPLSDTESSNADQTVKVGYERFAHLIGDSQVTVHIENPEKTLRLWVSQEFLERAEMRNISPQPDHVEVQNDGHVLVFTVSKPGEPVTISFDESPHKIGLLKAQIGIENNPSADINQFVYP